MPHADRPAALSILVLALAGFLGAPPGRAAWFEKNGLEIGGDFRTRLEADFDSRTATGAERDDRTRLRVRLRLTLDYAPTPKLDLGLRLRTGSAGAQQSAHVTVVDFDDGPTSSGDVNVDKLFLATRLGKTRAWIGRNSLPFWKRNELAWDDDVTPVGLGVSYGNDGGDGLELNAGYFALPVGTRDLSGRLGLAQAVWRRGHTRLGAGLLAVDADPSDPDGALLLGGNGARDYQIWVASLESAAGKWTFGVDWMHNGESYPASEPLRDEVDGYAGSLELSAGGGWRLAYTYAHVEALAVHSSYAQDDWVRWGSATQVRATDFEGHELRVVKDLGKGRNLMLRLYLVEAITTIEVGSRVRIDWNAKF